MAYQNDYERQKAFFDEIANYEKENDFPKLNVRLTNDQQLSLPSGISSETAHDIIEIYNRYFQNQ